MQKDSSDSLKVSEFVLPHQSLFWLFSANKTSSLNLPTPQSSIEHSL